MQTAGYGVRHAANPAGYRVSSQLPNVRVQVLIAERFVDHIADGVDIAFRLGALKDSWLVARETLTYRHQLVEVRII
jgi:hypothetical protein